MLLTVKNFISLKDLNSTKRVCATTKYTQTLTL